MSTQEEEAAFKAAIITELREVALFSIETHTSLMETITTLNKLIVSHIKEDEADFMKSALDIADRLSEIFDGLSKSYREFRDISLLFKDENSEQ